MKAKLIKTEKGYGLVSADKTQPIASTLNPHDSLKLSQQNCDEIFGVVDVEKLSSDYANERLDEEYSSSTGNFQAFSSSFRDGFNKAMELNWFTLEDMRKAYYVGYEDGKSGATFFQQLIQSLQQPTEVEVMIVMEEVQEIYRDGTVKWERCPKLDSEGCLVLTKKI